MDLLTFEWAKHTPYVGSQANDRGRPGENEPGNSRIRRPLRWNSQRQGYRSGGRGESIMGFGRGVLLWLLGVPIPIILLLAMCSHHG
jgi:hypothetical protein